MRTRPRRIKSGSHLSSAFGVTPKKAAACARLAHSCSIFFCPARAASRSAACIASSVHSARAIIRARSSGGADCAARSRAENLSSGVKRAIRFVAVRRRAEEVCERQRAAEERSHFRTSARSYRGRLPHPAVRVPIKTQGQPMPRHFRTVVIPTPKAFASCAGVSKPKAPSTASCIISSAAIAAFCRFRGFLSFFLVIVRFIAIFPLAFPAAAHAERRRRAVSSKAVQRMALSPCLFSAKMSLPSKWLASCILQQRDKSSTSPASKYSNIDLAESSPLLSSAACPAKTAACRYVLNRLPTPSCISSARASIPRSVSSESFTLPESGQLVAPTGASSMSSVPLIKPSTVDGRGASL